MKRSESGFSLISVLIAVGMFAILATFVSKFLFNSQKAALSTERRVDLKMLARSFSENVDCGLTLSSPSFTDPAFVPIVCGSRPIGTVTLRRKDNRAYPNSMGGFDIRAGCTDNRLAIEVRKRGTLKNVSEFVDAFSGTGDLCHHYFTANPICPPGQGVIGQAGPVPVCGSLGNPNNVITREVRGAVGSASRAQVSCLPNELRLACGGSRQPDLNDTCREEDCGLVGVMPVGTHGCEVGIDSDSATQPTVYAMCMPVR